LLGAPSDNRAVNWLKMKLTPILFAALCLSLPLRTRASGSAQVMVDACATDDPGILHLFDATSFMLNLNYQQVVRNSDQTYAMVPMGTYTDSPFGPLDPASAYYGLPQAPTGRTAVLISSNTLLTVAHQVPFGYTFYVYIFGLRAQMIGGVCQYPDAAHIPAENVYFASTGADGQYNGVVLNTHSPTSLGDYVVITLDRPVVGRTPLAVRKSGFASPQARFAGVSFSQRLIPAKADLAIQHMNESSPTGVDIANTSMLPGASGSPIYNLDEGVIETLDAMVNSCVYFSAEASGLYLLQENCPGISRPSTGPSPSYRHSPVFATPI
jgi:hypothetical protein